MVYPETSRWRGIPLGGYFTMTFHSVLSWTVVFGLGLAGIVAAVQAVEPRGLLAATGFVSLLLALVGISERSALIRKQASRSAIESRTARYMGLAWLWGAIAIFAVYVFLLSWREWPQFVAGFGIAGLLSLGYSALLARDAAAGRDDETMLKIGRYLCIGQLVGMIVTIVGLFIDPDKEFIYIDDSDWAGNGIFLFGALSLLLLSLHALRTSPKAKA